MRTGLCPLSMEGHFKLRLQSLKVTKLKARILTKVPHEKKNVSRLRYILNGLFN